MQIKSKLNSIIAKGLESANLNGDTISVVEATRPQFWRLPILIGHYGRFAKES